MSGFRAVKRFTGILFLVGKTLVFVVQRSDPFGGVGAGARGFFGLHSGYPRFKPRESLFPPFKLREISVFTESLFEVSRRVFKLFRTFSGACFEFFFTFSHSRGLFSELVDRPAGERRERAENRVVLAFQRVVFLFHPPSYLVGGVCPSSGSEQGR